MGNQAAFDLVEALATCNSLPSVLDSLVSSLNTSVMEDNADNDMENVTKDHEKRSKGFTALYHYNTTEVHLVGYCQVTNELQFKRYADLTFYYDVFFFLFTNPRH